MSAENIFERGKRTYICLKCRTQYKRYPDSPNVTKCICGSNLVVMKKQLKIKED